MKKIFLLISFLLFTVIGYSQIDGFTVTKGWKKYKPSSGYGQDTLQVFFVENKNSGGNAAFSIIVGSDTALFQLDSVGTLYIKNSIAAAGVSKTYLSIKGTTPAHSGAATPTDIFLDITPTVGIPTIATNTHLVDLTFTSPAYATAVTSNIRAIYIAPTVGNASLGTNTLAGIDIANITGDAQISVYGIRIGAMTGTAATENAIEIGAGWDAGISSLSPVSFDDLTVDGDLTVGDSIDDLMTLNGKLTSNQTYSTAATIFYFRSALTATSGEHNNIRGRAMNQAVGASTSDIRGVYGQATTTASLFGGTGTGVFANFIAKNLSTTVTGRALFAEAETEATPTALTNLYTAYFRTKSHMDIATGGDYYLLMMESEKFATGFPMDAYIGMKTSTWGAAETSAAYGIDMNGITKIGTADIRLHNGALFNNSSASLLTITEANVDIDGAFTASTMVSDATVQAITTFTTGANAGTSGQVNFIASDNDLADIEINTSDEITFNDASGGYVFDGDISTITTKKYYMDGISGHTYLAETASDVLSTFVGGVEAVTIEEATNIIFAIDKATPDGVHPDYTAIQLGGNTHLTTTRAVGANAVLHLTHNANLDTDGSWEYISTDEATRYRQTSGTHDFYVVASGTAGDDITWISALTIEIDGDIIAGFDLDVNDNLTAGDIIIEETVGIVHDSLVIKRECSNVVDDGTITLPDATTQSLLIWVDGDDEWAQCAIQADGTVTILTSVGSVVNTDTDTNLCIYDSGTGATIRQRLGSSKVVCYETKYKQ